MYDYIFYGAFSLMVLFGTARSVMLFAEQRRDSLRQRLSRISIATSSNAEPGPLTLRRPLLKRPRSLYLLPASLFARLEAALAATGNRIGPLHLITTGIVSAAAAIGFAFSVPQFPPSLMISLGVSAACGGPALRLWLAQGRYQRRFLDLFPDALDLIVRAVRAGLPALEAIDLSTREIAPPVGTEFQRMLDEMSVGIEMEDALRKAADRVRVPEFRFLVACLVLQRRTGGGLADTLSNLSAVIRQRRAVRLKARALTAETKASAVVVAVMPFVAGTGLFFINPQMMLSLFLDPRGRFMLGIAVFSLSLGITMMIAIIRKGPR